MRYVEYKPIEPLSKYIQLIWAIESESQDDSYPREKIMPDGIVEIVFHYGEPFINYFAGGRKVIQPKGFAISQMQKFIEIESNGKIGFVSVRFYPWGAHHFFNEPVNKFVDDIIGIEQLWHDDYAEILTAITKAEFDDKAELIQNYFLKKLIKEKDKYDFIDNAVKLIRDTKGQLSIDELCKLTNLSYKQLERNFLKTIGATPKVFSRNTRFLHLCHNLKDYENKTMAQLTYDMGYYDQSHFIKEFKDFSGLKPKEYFEHKNICFADF